MADGTGTGIDMGAIVAAIERHAAQRAVLMPNERTCLLVMFNAYDRLHELGWRDAIYCPKDGTAFDAISAGSTGIGDCCYLGEWPNGGFFVAEAGDLWPANPILFRLKAPEAARG